MKKYVTSPKSLIDNAKICYTAERLEAPDKLPNLFIANGRFGGCVDLFGRACDTKSVTRSYFWHKHHVEVGTCGIECRLPLITYGYDFYKDGEKAELKKQNITDYSQTLDIGTATVTTEFTLIDTAKVKIVQFVSAANTYMSNIRLSVEPLNSGVTARFDVKMLSDIISHHSVHIDYPAEIISVGNLPVLCSNTSRGQAHAALICKDSPTVITGENQLGMDFSFDKSKTVDIQLLLVSCRGDEPIKRAIELTQQTDAAQKECAHKSAWQDFWNRSMIDTEDEQIQNIWLRYLYYLRSSESTTDSVPLSPGGLASSGLWPFEFAQDYNWMYESYFITNHLDIAGGTARYWNTIIEQCREFTRKYVGVDGAFIPWMPSYFDLKEMTKPAFDPPFSWQLHNAAYPVHMIKLYWQYTHDNQYLAECLPTVEAIADFYTAITTYNDDLSKYEIVFNPCMGQDEYGGFNKTHYMCCMLSAAYTIKTVLAMYAALGQEPKKSWVDIDSKGYCFEKLTVTGMFATYDGGPTPNPAQKHPSQLNAIAALPLPEIYKSEAFVNTHKNRYGISMKAPENFWSGWSLGTFLIAASRMRDKEECDKDFGMFLTNADAKLPQTDSRYIQFYETGGYNNGASYFHTVMGMMVSAITELYVQCFDGECTVFPVILSKLSQNRLAFDDLLTPFGFTVSGVFENGKAEITLDVKEDCDTVINLGPDCKGEYTVTDQSGNTVAVADSSNRIIFKAPKGIYTIV